jgi:hypothetical protein
MGRAVSVGHEMRKEIVDIAKRYVERIDRAVRINRTSLIVELYRYQADRDFNRIDAIRDIQSAIDQEVWCEIVNRKEFRSDSADWIVA